MNEQKFKTCRYCKEQINAAAKICPRCRQWLSALSLRNPATWFVVFCLWALLLLLGFDVDMHKALKPGIDFLPYKGQISVTQSRMDFGTGYDKTPMVYITAVVTNQTDVAWNLIPLEVRFFDKTGKLIDVAQGDYTWILYPKSDAAVRIDTETIHQFANYDSYKIYVGYAHDPHSRF